MDVYLEAYLEWNIGIVKMDIWKENCLGNKIFNALTNIFASVNQLKGFPLFFAA